MESGDIKFSDAFISYGSGLSGLIKSQYENNMHVLGTAEKIHFQYKLINNQHIFCDTEHTPRLISNEEGKKFNFWCYYTGVPLGYASMTNHSSFIHYANEPLMPMALSKAVSKAGLLGRTYNEVGMPYKYEHDGGKEGKEFLPLIAAEEAIVKLWLGRIAKNTSDPIEAINAACKKWYSIDLSVITKQNTMDR